MIRFVLTGALALALLSACAARPQPMGEGIWKAVPSHEGQRR
ncbi:hypothetical protein SAMN04488115_107311 [Bosea lathyri]|uniref:Uncharacterized protein n=1 Tax=Bosea lathyri TaxID=1036778 RepID=A0A1H6BK80_9HYPH|nr:hypothetical protein SAMN04488115_107311 [Bosea lathyri]